MARPRALDAAEEAALIVMKRAGAADKDIMARFDIGRQTIYDIMARGEKSCTETQSVQRNDSQTYSAAPLMGSTAA
jgi:transposase